MIIADDLFAGAGGWDLGAVDHGIEARGVENMPEARATREAAGLTTIHDDVWTFRPDGKAQGKIASPPCPTFSQAGSGSGRRALESVLRAIRDGAYLDLDMLRAYPVDDDDDRTRLVLTPLHFATQHDYRWLAWEQVPTVLPIWEACAEVLRERGFSVWVGNLHAEQYGVPQTRKRAFLLASRDREVVPPIPTHSRYYSRSPERLDEGVLPWVSMAQVLEFGLAGRPAPTVTDGGIGGGNGAEPISHVRRWTEREDWVYRNNPMPNQAARRLDQPAPTLAMGHEVPRWYLESNYSGPPVGDGPRPLGRRELDTPAPTVTGRAHKWRNAANSVRVTVAEAGVLQTFPGDYPWQGRQGKQYLQAGNAVPPLLARAALSAVIPNLTQEV